MLLAEHLILSVTSPPLKSITHIAQAAAMLPENELEELEIDPKEVETLLTISNLLAEPVSIQDQSERIPVYNIPITSLEPEWDRYFKPWVKMKAYSYRFESNTNKMKLEQRAREAGGITHHRYAFRHLSGSGYRAALTDFLEWATPKAQRIAEKISTLVDQRTFSDVMKMIQKPIESNA